MIIEAPPWPILLTPGGRPWKTGEGGSPFEPGRGGLTSPHELRDISGARIWRCLCAAGRHLIAFSNVDALSLPVENARHRTAGGLPSSGSSARPRRG